MKYFNTEGQTAEFLTADSKKSRKYGSMFDDNPWWLNSAPQHWSGQLEAKDKRVGKVPQAVFNI